MICSRLLCLLGVRCDQKDLNHLFFKKKSSNYLSLFFCLFFCSLEIKLLTDLYLSEILKCPNLSNFQYFVIKKCIVDDCYLIAGSLKEFCEDYITPSTAEPTRPHRCIICNKTFSTRQVIENHIESLHFPDTFMHTCRFCGETLGTRKKLSHHQNKHHGQLTAKGSLNRMLPRF